MLRPIKDAAKELLPEDVWSTARAYSKTLDLGETNRFNFFPVSHDPLVIYSFTGHTLGNVFHMSGELGGRKALFVVGFTRYPIKWKIKYLSRQLRVYGEKFPQNKVAFLCNSREECKNLRNEGFEACLVNKNAFQREDMFVVEEDSGKKYAAVMNARMKRWKRVELACKVRSLALITVLDDEEYFAEMKEVLSHADWVNFNDGDYRYLSREEVRDIVNQSRTGLILSALEGNNKASIEYLLCGVPVVSTPSKGGRDVFFDDEYCAIVEPDPEAVREGVERMIQRNLDPRYIRQKTLAKIRGHRERFLQQASDLVGSELDVDVDEWLDYFPRNMKFRCKPEHFLDFLDSDYLRGVPEYTNESSLREQNRSLWEFIVHH